jgi:hypothetical protein
VKGDDMAVSKHSRKAVPATNPFFLKLFRNSSVSRQRERAWLDAVRHVRTEDPPLRFPVYEHLYRFNAHAQEMVELLGELGSKFAIGRESMLYHQSLIQCVRASVSQGIVELMNGVELTDAWLHQSQQRVEESKLRDPDDVYISVRRREAERLRQRLPPRIRFLDEPLAAKTPAAKKAKKRKAV